MGNAEHLVVLEGRKGPRAGEPSGGPFVSFDAVRLLDTPVWVYDIDNCRIAMANGAACRLWQAEDEETLCARDMSPDMSSTVAKRLRQYQIDFVESDATFKELWTLYPEGKPTSVMVLFRGYRLDDGRMAMLCEATGQAEDQPENLRSAEALLHTDVMITLYDLKGPPLYMNPAARNAAADPKQELSDIFVERAEFDLLSFELDKAGEHRMVAKVRTAAGHCWFDISAKLCSDAATGDPAILVTAIDVSELKNARDKARYLANRDQLTGCFNRTFLQHRMAELDVMQPRRCALLFFDVDRFKHINDRFGHEMGDKVLKELVARARNTIRKGDLIARLGGDEFVILFEDTPDDEVFGREITRLADALSQPFHNESSKLNVTVSMGISFFTPATKPFTTVLREADIALYASKQGGCNRVTYFSDELGVAMAEKDRIEIELKRAIENQDFVLHYQPRVDLKTRRVVSAEALVRWMHPKRGLIMPSEFIPICEDTGMIEELGRQVLEMGCRQAMEWSRLGLDIDVSINISPRQFNDEGLMQALDDFSQTDGFPTGRLELEITESVLIGDHELIAEKLEAITRMGYRIAIDDFGIGYSNLSYISRFPLKCLKIDRSFIQQLPKSGPIIRLILTLADQIGATTVAEGVEREAECDWLSAQNCDQVQGFHFSRPVPLSELVSRIEDLNARLESRNG